MSRRRAGEMLEVVLELGRAVEVRATGDGFAVEAHRRRRAYGASTRQGRALEAQSLGDRLPPPIEAHPHDLGNHVSGTLDHDAVADPDILAFDLVLIVERGVRDRDAADPDGSQARDRGQGAGATDLDLDAFEHGLAAGGELEGDGPARGPGEAAELGLLVESVDLEDRAVDLDGQLPAAALEGLVEGDGRVHALAGPDLGADEESPVAETVEDLGLAFDFGRAPLLEAVGTELETA